jgi:hypothetical protein
LKRRRAEQTEEWLNGFKADIMNKEEQEGFRILGAGIPDGRTIKECDMTLKLAIQMLEDLGAIQKELSKKSLIARSLYLVGWLVHVLPSQVNIMRGRYKHGVHRGAIWLARRGIYA